MYFVGIDISKFKHDCIVIDEIGDTNTAPVVVQQRLRGHFPTQGKAARTGGGCQDRV